MAGLLQNIELNGSELPKLEGLREKGRQSFRQQGLPTAKTEAWKYTRVRELEADDFIIETAAPVGCQCHEKECTCHSLPFPAYEIKFCNGILAHDHFHLPEGIEAMSLLDAVFDHEAAEYLNKNFNMDALPFAALNTAYLEQGIFLRIRRDVKLTQPIALVYHSHAEQKFMANIRNLIVVESGAEAELIEFYHYAGHEKSEYFNNIINEIYLGRNARLQHYKFQNEAFKAIHIALNAVRVKEAGNYQSFCLLKGANLARNESRIMLREQNAAATVNAAYVMNGWATLDTTTDIEHLAPDTISHQLVKGVIGGQAKGVFQGKIHIAPNAVKTEGYQLHKALLLSDDAEVDVKPELEIFADDVKCSHGAASGDLDAEQLFYLRSRGIGEDEAKQLLIAAFIDEAVNSIENESIREWIKISRTSN